MPRGSTAVSVQELAFEPEQPGVLPTQGGDDLVAAPVPSALRHKAHRPQDRDHERIEREVGRLAEPGHEGRPALMRHGDVDDTAGPQPYRARGAWIRSRYRGVAVADGPPQ